jgi:hypothetical protein
MINRLPTAIAARVAAMFANPSFGRSFLDDAGLPLVQEIDGIAYRFSEDGEVLDAYRLSRPRSRSEMRRSEVNHATLKVRPIALSYDATNAQAFLGIVAAGDRRALSGLAPQMSTVYAVRRDGALLGLVAQTRFTADQAGAKPQVQWLATCPKGVFWGGFGRTREEAARHLLAQSIRSSRLAEAA